MKVWPISIWDSQTTYFCKVQSLWFKLKICFTTISDLEQLYISLSLNAETAVQMFYFERVFVFFMTLFLKKMGIILSASKPGCHSRLSKPVLKILSIHRKNIFGKQLSLAICSKYVFGLLHAPKFQMFSKKFNMVVKVAKLFTGVLWKRCSDNFTGKHMQESLF